MSEDTSVLWLTLDLDPGTADFFGLPSRISVPEDREAPLLGDESGAMDLSRLVPALERAAALRPDDPDRLRLLRFARRWPRYADLDRYLRMGNATFAAAVAGRLLADDPQDPPALAARSLLAAREAEWDRALDLLERVSARAPTHALTRLYTALCLAGAGRGEEGLALLDDLVRHPRLAALARFWRHELRSDRPVPESLRRAMEAAAGIQDTPTAFDRLETAYPGNPEVLYARALRLSGTEQSAQRETCLRRALDADPAHVPAAALLAGLLRATGRAAEALDVLDRALAETDGHPLLLAGRGQVLEQQGRGEEALAAYRAALSGPLAAVPATALLLAGQGLIRLGAGDEARSALTDAVAARPGDPLPYRLLARLDEHAAGREAAERRLRDAVKACGPEPSLQYALGDLLRRSGRVTEAEGLFKVLVRRHPRAPWGYRGLGDLRVTEQPAEAVRRYAEALERAPDLPIPGHDYLVGVSALRAGDVTAARRRLERAAALEPDNARYWCDLGAALFYSEDLEGALAATGRALQLRPGHPGFLHNLAEYHRVRFRRSPFRAWRSGWTAWRLERQAARAARSGWKRDLWRPAESDAEARPKPTDDA